MSPTCCCRTALAAALLLAAGFAQAGNCTIDLDSDDAMKFDKAALTVSASCPEITINLRHTGRLPATAMGHNVVIAASDVWQAVAQDGVKAGPGNHYVPQDDDRVVGFTHVIGGGEQTTASFPGSRLSAGTSYMFFCSFPGHWAIMKGELSVTP